MKYEDYIIKEFNNLTSRVFVTDKVFAIKGNVKFCYIFKNKVNFEDKLVLSNKCGVHY